MELMLVNATHNDELRVARVRDNFLYDLDIESPNQNKKKNIYKAVITRVEQSLEAVFVEYGANRQGFLPFKEISPEYFSRKTDTADASANMKQVLREGQDLLVQVEKEERGTKGAALTTFITLAGCYLVLMPNNPTSGGISRRIEGDDRDELKERLNNLTMPEGMGVIIRTAGLGKSSEDLQWDLDGLLNQWFAIKQVYDSRSAPCLIHQEGDAVIRSIRDNLRREVDQIIIDNQEVFVKAKNYMEEVKPDYANRIRLYQDSVPLFNRYNIEKQIETAYHRDVQLPSGGSLVIDRTEALVSIDINSAKSTSGSDIESTAFATNIEAANEIARQLRLRDLGGLIVIDFIDMTSTRNQREVENALREALRFDRARVQIGRISRFGLLEMSRQRLRLSLGETTQDLCPRCTGRGVIRSVQSLAISATRLIEEEAIKEQVVEVRAHFPIELATYLVNEKRDVIAQIQKRHNTKILIIPNPYLETPHYKIEGMTEAESGRKRSKVSYDLIENPEVALIDIDQPEQQSSIEPALKHVPAVARPQPEAGLLKRLWRSLFGGSQTPAPVQRRLEVNPEATQTAPRNNNRRPGQNRRRRRQGGNRGGRSQGGDSRRPAEGNKPQTATEQSSRTVNNQPHAPTAPRPVVSEQITEEA